MKRGRPVRPAYSDTGADQVPCANCGAGVGQWCSRDGEEVRRVPCVARVADASLFRVDAEDSYFDFSEPRHPRTETAEAGA